MSLDWPGLLAWSTKYHDGTKPSEFKQLSDEDREFLEKAMEEAFGKIEDPNQVMAEAIAQIKSPERTEASITTALEILDRSCDDPDCARNAEKLDGVQPLLDLLSTQGPVLRMRTFEILALFFSNNTHIQEAGIRRGAVPLFLRLMRGSAPGSDERNKAFRTLVALIRKIEAAEESFLRETDGIAVLVACMSLDELPALQEKAASFVRSLGGDRRLRPEDVASLAPAVGQLLQRAGENTRHIQYRETLAQCACELAVVAPTVCQDSLAEGVKARLAELTTASEPSEVEQEKAALEDCKQALGQ